jgi:hypothetical protein
MSKYVVTGITYNGNRIKPIFVDKKPAQRTSHLSKGSIWKLDRSGKRKLIRKFSNNELVLLP